MAKLFVFDPLNSSHPQLRYAWNSTQLACEPVKTDSSDLGFISIVLSDIAVSLITLAGLPPLETGEAARITARGSFNSLKKL
jgi:hypothetical protein